MPFDHQPAPRGLGPAVPLDVLQAVLKVHLDVVV
jgi:hypothetical protein